MKQLPGLSGKCLPYGHFLPYRRLQIENSNLVRIKGENDCSCLFEAWRKLIPVWLKVAAAVILLIGCNLLVYVYGKSSIYQRRFSLRNQGSCRIRTNIVLPDRTEVSLNTGSCIAAITVGLVSADVM